MKIRYFFVMLFCIVITATLIVTMVENKNMKIRNRERNDILKQIEKGINNKEIKKVNQEDIELESVEKLYAKSACVIDSESKRVLYAKNAYSIMSMASTTKIMTCIIALESGYADEKAIVSNYASSMPNVQLNVVPGEIITIRDMLYSLMLESHNDIAVAIAENIALYSLDELEKDNTTNENNKVDNVGKLKNDNILKCIREHKQGYDNSKYTMEGYKDVDFSKSLVKIFAEMMNQKAIQLGMLDTSFVTPNGLDADNHHTTAYDMALLGSYAIQNKEFLDIVGRKSYTLKSYKVPSDMVVNEKNNIDKSNLYNGDLENYKNYTVYNKDMFLDMYKGAIGCKTGYTSKAGYCFVGAIDRPGYKLVSVVLASGWPPNKNYKWKDTVELMDGVIASYTPKTVNINNNILNIKPIEIQKSISNKRYINFEIDKTYNMLISDKDKISYKVYMPSTLMAPVKKGEVLGKYDIYLNGNLYDSESIISSVNIDKRSYKKICIYLIKQIFMILECE